MLNKITKAEIRQSLSDAIQTTASKYGASPLSKKQTKAIENFSRKLAIDIKDAIKKRITKEGKVIIKKAKKPSAAALTN